MILDALFVAIGIVLLYGGGELLVSGATGLARRFGISPLVVGLTVVAFATSCPELAATVTAALRDDTAMALGNAIGSNIANIGLILGLSALIYPLATHARFLRREVAFMTLVTVLMYPVLLSGTISRFVGVIFLGGLVFYLVTLIRDPSSMAEYPVDDDDDASPASVGRASTAVTFGIFMLAGGAYVLVEGASNIASALGVPSRVIGLTVVAFGTSLPELATSIVAARKHEVDIILGNVVGSNIFNLLFILGTTALVRPMTVPAEVLRIDFWVLLGMTVAIFVLLGTRHKLTRGEGTVLLSGYVLYTGYLFA